MDSICGVICFFIALIIIVSISSSAADRAEQIRQANDAEHQKKIDTFLSHFKFESSCFDSYWRQIFQLSQDYPTISHMRDPLKEMEEAKNQLISLDADRQYTATIELNKKKLQEYEKHCNRVCVLPVSMMINPEKYGSINNEYWETTRSMTPESAGHIIEDAEKRINSNQADQIFSIDMEKLLQCIWFYATDKPYSAAAFNTAAALFHKLYMRHMPGSVHVEEKIKENELNPERFHIDVKLAECYAIKQMGGNDLLWPCIQEVFRMKVSPKEMELFASGLMWMQAYTEEVKILKRMLSEGMEMSVKAQERLHALSNGSGNAPSGLDVSSDNVILHFDMSSLAWKADEYIGFFENLSFKDQILSYALAIRDETKELILPAGLMSSLPQEFSKKMQTIFNAEYGDDVTVEAKKCIAHSGASEESLECILAHSEKCSQLGVLVYVARVGKRINIKFYTLFLPNVSDISLQKQQVLSMYNRLSPSVSMWEDSMKDTFLTGIQQMLNFHGQSDPVNGGTESRDAPIF